MASYGDKVSFKVNKQNLEAVLSKVLRKKIKQLAAEFKTTLDSPVFEWDSVTKRKNGETVGSKRNAVDTGALSRSIRVEFVKSGTGIIKFDKEYAALVLSHASEDLVKFTLARMRNK